MIRFYLNRELSETLDIRLSRWKRWSREFLPPDPLGGMQSGYARQYTLEQAFTVYVGGHLVSDLKFSVHEAKQIMGDLGAWLREQSGLHLMDDNTDSHKIDRNAASYSTVFIFRKLSADNSVVVFTYLERIRISDEAYEFDGADARREVYSERWIPGASTNTSRNRHAERAPDPASVEKIDGKIVYITDLYKRFASKVKV